jgi:hypothetical protein
MKPGGPVRQPYSYSVPRSSTILIIDEVSTCTYKKIRLYSNFTEIKPTKGQSFYSLHKPLRYLLFRTGFLAQQTFLDVIIDRYRLIYSYVITFAA